MFCSQWESKPEMNVHCFSSGYHQNAIIFSLSALHKTATITSMTGILHLITCNPQRTLKNLAASLDISSLVSHSFCPLPRSFQGRVEQEGHLAKYTSMEEEWAEKLYSHLRENFQSTHLQKRDQSHCWFFFTTRWFEIILQWPALLPLIACIIFVNHFVACHCEA